MGEDDYSWLMNDDSGIDPGFDLGSQPLLPMIPQPEDQIYDPMVPFDPSDPSYGNWAINWDGSPVAQLPGGSGGGGKGFDIMRALGLHSLGSGGLGQILMAALGIGGGLFNRTNTQHATDQAVGALQDANKQITGILGGNNEAFRPYADLGAYAAHGLQNLPLTPIAGNFNPLGTGRGIKLGSLTGH